MNLADLAALAETPEGRHALLIEIERELYTRSFAAFTRAAWDKIEPGRLLWNWHLDAISELLEAVALGQVRNLLINIPPGCMKSLEVSTFYPSWDWVGHPERKFITSTYAQKLSLKNARLHRSLVLSDWYQERFPNVRLTERADGMFKNTAGGFRFSTSVTGTATGEHGDVIICDDLIKSRDAEGRAAVSMVAIEAANEHRFKTLITRRANPDTTAFITIMQRLHYGDPAQRCIDAGDHVCLILPMEYDPRRKCVIEIPEHDISFSDPRETEGELLWPDRFSAETVEEIRHELGPIAAAAQLDQNPSPIKGAIFEQAWFEKRWTEVPTGRQIMTVDCTFKDTAKSDYVAIQVWAVQGNRYYLVDAKKGQWDVIKTAEEVVAMTKRHPRAVGVHVEDKANGPAICQILRDRVSGLREWSPGRSPKEERAASVAPLVAVDCWFPPDSLAPWMGDYISEMTKFPRGKNDDQVDATTMALLILHKRGHRKQRAAYAKMR